MPDFNVLDLSSGVAGPYATRILAGYGAKVTKVERPHAGDWGRRLPPLKGGLEGPEASALFAFLNAGKRSLTLDLTAEAGRAILRRLVARADLVVESIRPARKRDFGVDAGSLVAANARVASVSVTNFGETGPNRDLPATEITLQAWGAIMGRTGAPDREPLKVWGHQAQLMGGMNVFTAAMAVLLGSRRDGKAHHADVSIVEAAVQFHHGSLLKWAFEQAPIRRGAGAVVANGVYPAADGYAGIVVVGAGKGWRVIPKLMDDPRLGDERFRTLYGRARHGDEVEALMLPWVTTHGREEIYELGQAAGVPFASVRRAEDVLASKQLRARGFFRRLHPPGMGEVEVPGPPVRLGGADWQEGEAPALGAHNHEVLAELGLSVGEIRDLEEHAVV